MENSVNTMKSSSTHSLRHRKSIFASDKPKPDEQDPKLLLNGQTLTQWQTNKPSTSPNFYPSTANNGEQTHHMRPRSIQGEGRHTTGSFYLGDHPVNRVIITNSNQQSSCVRPSSLGRRSVIINQPQIIERPVSSILTHSRVLTGPPPQILTNSRIIPSQTTNFAPSNIIITQASSNLKRKSIMVEGRPHENVIFRHSPIKTTTISQIRPEVSRVIIQDDPKTISQLNKLASLNQFLSQQYTLVNNELIFLKNNTRPRDIVDGNTFLEKSLNKIDDIFLRETNQALYKLDQISRCTTTNGFSRSSGSRMKRNSSPSFNKINVTQQVQQCLNPSNVFTPIKGVEQLQNSSYIQCNHIDPMAVYDEDA